MKWKRNMEPVDFSSLHGILLEDSDGNIQPMDQPLL